MTAHKKGAHKTGRGCENLSFTCVQIFDIIILEHIEQYRSLFFVFDFTGCKSFKAWEMTERQKVV